jgi:anti-sigma factor RsiW
VNRDLARYFEMLVSGDARPAERLRASVVESCQALARSLASWRNLEAADRAALNRLLTQSKQAPFAPIAVPETPSCMP